MNEEAFKRLAALVIDDEIEALRSHEMTLRSGGVRDVICCQDSRAALSFLSDRDIGVVLLDLTMPNVPGQELLLRIVENHPDVPVVVVTGANDIETAVQCMKAGALDYLLKPVESGRLISIVRRTLEARELARENAVLREGLLTGELRHSQAFAEIRTNSPAMRAVFRYVEAVAATPRPVLILGETGVGKELIARALHRISGRKGRFVAVNAAGLDDLAFSDSLFGHRKGAFTGADEQRAGLIRDAAEGTLFLDEIGDLPLGSQVKLLRLLQEHEFFPLGSDVPLRSDARVIVATNRDLDAAMAAHEFRKDLYFRLQTHQVRIPPLRERPADLPILVDHFLEKAAATLSKPKPTPPAQLLDLLSAYPFPGNIRELESMIFDAVSRHRSHTLSLDSFREHILGRGGLPGSETDTHKDHESPFAHFEVLPPLKDVPQLLVDEALRRANGNQTLAAQLLGISQSSLNKRVRRTLR